MLFGQMFGILTPVLILPGVVAVLAVIILASRGWQLPTDYDWRDWLLIAVQVMGMFLLYLFIYHGFRTSGERARLVNELQAANKQLEQAREAEIELAALRERERVARDLHDGLGHSLVTMSVQLEAIQRLYPVDSQQASAQIDELKRLTRDSMNQLRHAIEGLRAPERDGRPLSAALRERIATAARGGVAVSADVDDRVDELPPLLADVIWRVTQEALNNVERHAGARHVSARVAVEADHILAHIADDGRGLPPDAADRSGHYGLRGMRERVEGVGGTLQLEANDGTTITATIPYRAV
jgi:signal transduction histidine kinase